MKVTPCPHVVTSDEGTSYCNLAESTVRELKAELAQARDDLAREQRQCSAAILDYNNEKERADAATARADALHKALREQTVVLDPMAWGADAKWCELCCTGWIHPGPERHAPGCLAALAEQEKP